MTYPYNSAYNPPIPSLQVYLSVPDRDTSVGPLDGIVDTGADGTMIPVTYLRQLTAKTVDDAWVRSHWGEWRQVVLYMVDIRVESITAPGLYVVGDEQGDEIVLGRNFLNRFQLLLDGPATETRMLNT